MSSGRLRSSLTHKTSSSFNTSEMSELSGNEESSVQFDSADERRTKPPSINNLSKSIKYEESDDVFEDEGVNVSGSADEDFIKTIVLEGKPPWGFTIVDESSQGQTTRESQKGRKLSDSSIKKLTPNYIVQKVSLEPRTT